MNFQWQLVAIVAVSLTAAGVTFLVKGAPDRRFFCDTSTLKPGEICLHQLSAADTVLWVDARPRKEWEKNCVPNSILWNLDPAEDMLVFESEAAMRIVETPRVIVYCGDENCGISSQVAARIRKLDLGAEVSVLRGGWRALSDAGMTKRATPIRDSNRAK